MTSWLKFCDVAYPQEIIAMGPVLDARRVGHVIQTLEGGTDLTADKIAEDESLE